MIKERLNELLNENTSLEEQVTGKENGLKHLQSEVERFEKELQLQGVDIDVRYKPRVLCDPPFHLDKTPHRPKLSRRTIS